MLTSIEQQKSDEMLNHIYAYETRINKEKITRPYPKPEHDVYGEHYINKEGYSRRRNYNSTAQRIAEIEADIIEEMHSENKASKVKWAVRHIQHWLPNYGGPLVDEAADNIRERILAGIIVVPPYEPSTQEEIIERYCLAFPDQVQQVKSCHLV